jgi:AraC-like DNA-binding protein
MKKAAAPDNSVRTDEPLLWLTGSAYEVLSPSHRFYCDASKRTDPHFAFQLTLSGAGFYERSGKRVLLKTGMAFIDYMPGDFRYGYPPEAQEEYKLVWVDVVGPMARYWWRQIRRSFGNIVNFGPDNPVAPLMLSIARQYSEGLLRDRYVISGQLHQLIMTAISTLNHSRLQTTPLIAQALASIQHGANDPGFGVEQIARELDCSREHLTRQFKAATGVSPSDYMLQHRLRLAARELRESNDKLELVAQRCGFSGANYFCRAFHRYQGLTPRQFRARPWMIKT